MFLIPALSRELREFEGSLVYIGDPGDPSQKKQSKAPEWSSILS